MGTANHYSSLQCNLSPPDLLLTIRVKQELVLIEQPELRKREVMFGKKHDQGIAVYETAELL